MTYIIPRIDYAFKKIFGDEKHKSILISFLNAILYDGEPTIHDLSIADNFNAPKIHGLKHTFMDITAVLNDGSRIIIEMQVLSVAGFGKRILYNVAKAYSAQLRPKGAYSSLKPVIGLTITDFQLFDEEEVKGTFSRYGLYDLENKMAYPENDIELFFVELPKFKKTVTELKTLTDKWLYFLRYASEVEAVPKQMQDEASIVEAFEIADRVNLTQAEIDELEKIEAFVYTTHTALEDLRQEIQDAEQKTKDAKQQTKDTVVTIAQNLLTILDDKMISQNTGLTLNEVRALR